MEEAVTDKQLISSFLRYVDDFEKEAIESMLNGNPVDDEIMDIALGVFSRYNLIHCQH